MQALIDKCHENIRHGESFDKVLLSGIFSQMYASWIAIGSRTGEMESIVSQREINTDTASYLTALRAALRQSPDHYQQRPDIEYSRQEQMPHIGETEPDGIRERRVYGHEHERESKHEYHRPEQILFVE